MKIKLNGTLIDIDENINLSTFIEQQGLAGKRLAIEVNEELVTRKKFDEFHLQENDQIEIVQAIGGG